MKKREIFRIFEIIAIVIFVFALIPGTLGVDLSSVSVTRGGDDGDGIIDGQFSISLGDDISEVPYALGFIINPMNMTGDYCDRPPYFADDNNFVFGVVEDEQINPPIDRGNLVLGTSSAVFKEMIPTPDNFISKGCWDIPWDGMRYLGRANSVGEYTLNTTYPSNYGIMGLKPDTYSLHAQRIDPNQQEFDIDGFADAEINVRYGDVDVQFLDYNDYKKGTLTPLTWAYISGSPGKVVIKGKNTDSFKTYLWLTGPDLPECGTGLQNVVSIPVSSRDPEVLTLPSNPWGNNKNPTAPHKFFEKEPVGSGDYTGEWEYVWDISDIALSPGDYTLYASSVDPSESLQEYCKGNISCKPDCSFNDTCLNDEGVCSLLSCDKCCAPPVAIAHIELKAPPKASLSIIPNVELCCCQEYPCQSNNCGPVSIPINGTFNIPRMPLQVWVFGNNLMANRSGYLFNDNMSTLLDDDGYFEMDVYRDIFKNAGICPCDLEPGPYYVVIQTPYRYKNGKELFDVTLEGSKAMNRITGGLIPRDQEQKIGSWRYVIESKPVYWTRSFAVEGEGSIGGYNAFSSLISLLSNYNDPYYILQFNVTDRCNQYVDFVAEPVYGSKPLTVQFTDKSTYGSTTNWLWDFGDGTTSTDRNPEHIYRVANKYTVSLTITSGNVPHSNIKWDYISINNPVGDSSQTLKVDFDVNGPRVGSAPLTVQFIDKSMGSPVGWSWNFGDGQVSSLQSPKNTYRSVGSYTVNLEIFDQNGSVTNTTKVGYVSVDSSAIKAAFRYNFPDTSDYTKVQFSDLSEGTGINKWSWNFGDGTPSANEQNPLHVYQAKGCYTVSLKAENGITSDLRSYRICI